MPRTDPARERAARRAAWRGRVRRDGVHDEVEVVQTSAEELLVAAWISSQAAAAFAGGATSRTARAEWPGEVRRPE